MPEGSAAEPQMPAPPLQPLLQLLLVVDAPVRREGDA